MSILDTIEKIQQKPEPVRRQIMYLALAVCMAIVFAIWAVNFSATLGSENNSAATTGTSTSPMDYLKKVWDDITTN